MKLDFSNSARDFLVDLSKSGKQYVQVTKKVLALGDDPRPADSSDLSGFKQPFRRVDCGEYRIVYVIEEDTVRIAVIGKRNDDEVYTDLRRQEKGK